VIASSTNRYLAISRDLVPLRWFEFAARPLMVSVAAGLLLKPFGNVLPDAASIALFAALTVAALTWTAQFSLTDLNEILSPPTH